MSNSNSLLRVLFLTCGDANKASSRVRGYWISDAINSERFSQEGIECRVEVGVSKWTLAKTAATVNYFDAVVFQKTYSRWHLLLQRWASRFGKSTFIDIDDAPSRVKSPQTLKNVKAMFQVASGVFAGSTNLVKFASQFNKNTFLIPSCVKLENYAFSTREKEASVVCLGWIGNGAHYQDDLIKILKPVLANLASKYEIRFKLVGACGVGRLYDEFGSVENLQIDFVDQIAWQDPMEVANSISDFDIGLYPLVENDFNEFKCGFKALEYMASGIPVVSSDVQSNVDIIDDGVDGMIATTTDDWIEVITGLIQNPAERRRLSKYGRQKVEAKFDTHVAAKQIIEIVKKACN